MKENPDLKVLVAGYTDKTASDTYNNVLSFNRAKAAVEFLVNNHGIARQRLILNFGGENENLVPSSGSNFMNRRVEFRVAKNEKDMDRPAGPDAGKGKFSGSKDAGY
jgi:outer membrane protein OmpA-like peptidoglycan-associated protein